MSGKRLIHLILLLTFVLFSMGCASLGSSSDDRHNRYILQIEHYEQQARDWKRDGHPSMAKYFANRADETRNAYVDNSGLGVILNVIFD